MASHIDIDHKPALTACRLPTAERPGHDIADGPREMVTDRKHDELLAGQVELGGVFLSQR
jgi:hypothetical protein